jgi:hypothetical protein
MKHDNKNYVFNLSKNGSLNEDSLGTPRGKQRYNQNNIKESKFKSPKFIVNGVEEDKNSENDLFPEQSANNKRKNSRSVSLMHLQRN